MARPRKEIDAEQVYKLAQLGCSYREIAATFGVDHKTVMNRFSPEKELGEARGNIAIRRWQMRRAKGGSDAMLALLGKSRLGQTDRVDVTTNGESVTRAFETVRNERDGAVLSATPPVGVLHEPG
jgi:hypothetical protein